MNQELRIKKKIVLLFYCSIVLLLQMQWVGPVFAQTATDSSSVIPTTIPTVSTINTPTPPPLPIDTSFQNTSTPSGQNTVPSQNPFLPLGTSTQPSSALFRLPVKIDILAKKDYRAHEGVKIRVENATSDEVNVSVNGPDGKTVTPMVTKTTNQALTTISVMPPDAFKPGKYTVTITSSDGTTSQQDFTWGVLAINTNKSIYLPSEMAHLAMAVLDDGGNMVCDAQVTLVITDPQGQKTTLSTDNKEVVINPQCKLHTFSLTPDYEASYQVNTAGSYVMDLTATTSDGAHTISDSFQVQESVPFDVERATATRIYPPLSYPTTFSITASQDFTGKVVELVPTSFDINPAMNGSTSYDTVVSVTPVAPMQDTFGVDKLVLGLPFSGNYSVTQGFGVAVLKDPQEQDLYTKFGLAGHDGLDFNLPKGTPVLSTDAGIVSFAGDGAYGTTIVIDHTWGRSYYGHLSKLEVTGGETIIKGQEIGLSGDSGLVTGPHLHFGIKPKNPNMNNGFYGKVDSSVYLGLRDDVNADLSKALPSLQETQKAIVWNVSVKKGDTINLGYMYKTPNISPQFYTIGPLSFVTKDNQTIFQEARVWQLAIDYTAFPATSYLSSTVSAAGTGATAWQIKTSAPASANTATTEKQGKTTGYGQWQPGVANTTNGGTIPTTPNGKGWIYDTSVNGTIPTGTWTFNVTTTSTSATGTGHVVVCAWVVHLSGGTSGTVTKDSTIFPSSANCAEGATNIMTQTTALNSSVSVASVPAVTFTQTQYLYVEYWLRMTVAGSSTTGTTTFTVNAGAAQDIVTPGASTNASPAAPSNDAPVNSATNQSINPVFKMTSATDAENNGVKYKVTIYPTATDCTNGTNPTQTDDGSTSTTGWSGLNATCVSGTDCYTIGTQGTFTTQTALSNSTTYYWKSSVVDPLGNGVFVNAASCNNFTTQAAGPTLDQLMRHGDWFSNGVRKFFTF